MEQQVKEMEYGIFHWVIFGFEAILKSQILTPDMITKHYDLKPHSYNPHTFQHKVSSAFCCFPQTLLFECEFF